MKIHQIKPQAGYVVVQPDAKQEKIAGIYQPGKGNEVPQFGKVILSGVLTVDQVKDGILSLKPGEQVIYKKWGGNDVTIDKKKFYFLKFEEIIGVVR